MMLPDSRYTAEREFCGHESAMFIPRFCGEWLRDSTIWPERASNQAPAYHTQQEAIEACHAYETERQRLHDEFLAAMARGNFYEANPQSTQVL